MTLELAPVVRRSRRPRAVLARTRPAAAPQRLALAQEASSLEESEINGADNRIIVANPIELPFWFICCLDMFFRRDDGSEPHAERGTGTLISPRHVLTAAHNVLDDLSEHGFPKGRRSPTWVFAAPGRHLQNLPFGRSKATKIRVSPEWKANAPKPKELIDEYDYALLTLENELGNVPHQALGGRALGWWSDPKLGGGTRIRPIEPAKLSRQAVNLSGYPSDKCEDRPPDRGLTFWEQQHCWTSLANQLNPQGSTQWRSFGRVVNPSPSDMRRAITYDLDSADGHSGSPVWLRWSGYRNLIAVNTSGYPGPTNEIIASLGVRITDQVVRQLRAWMREDGVTATF